MTKEGAFMLLRFLVGAYPRQFSPNMRAETAENTVETFVNAYADFNDSEVLTAYRKLLQTMKFAPSVAEVIDSINRNKADARKMPAYFEDEEGCGYLLNPETHQYDCIWKYWWKDSGKLKMQTLHQNGLS